MSSTSVMCDNAQMISVPDTAAIEFYPKISRISYNHLIIDEGCSVVFQWIKANSCVILEYPTIGASGVTEYYQTTFSLANGESMSDMCYYFHTNGDTTSVNIDTPTDIMSFFYFSAKPMTDNVATHPSRDIPVLLEFRHLHELETVLKCINENCTDDHMMYELTKPDHESIPALILHSQTNSIKRLANWEYSGRQNNPVLRYPFTIDLKTFLKCTSHLKDLPSATEPTGVNDFTFRSKFQTVLYREYTDRLAANAMLHDEIIHFFFSWLECLYPNENIFFCSTNFFTKLGTDGPQSVLNWLKKWKVDNSFSVIVVPLHLNYHWSLAAIVMPTVSKRTDVLLLDSIKGGHDKLFIERQLDPWLQEFLIERNRDPPSYFTPTVPIQSNKIDCGLFMLRFCFDLVRFGTQEFINDLPQSIHRLIQERKLFCFNQLNVSIMRIELHQLLHNFYCVHNGLSLHEVGTGKESEEERDTSYVPLKVKLCGITPEKVFRSGTKIVDEAEKKSKVRVKDGGYNIKNPLQSLTPGDVDRKGSNRYSFCVPVEGGRDKKTIDELTSGLESLFPIGRIFNTNDDLNDALNQYGIGHFSVCRHGTAFECSAGPLHQKTTKKKKGGKPSKDNSSDSENEQSSSPFASRHTISNKRKRGAGKESAKLGCNFFIRYNFLDGKEKRKRMPKSERMIKITNASYVHDVCKGDPVIYKAVHSKSHTSFHDFGYQAKVTLCYWLHQNRGQMSYNQIRTMMEPYMPKGFTLNPFEVRNLKERVKNFLPYQDKKLALEDYQTKMDLNGDKPWDGIQLFSHIKNGEASSIISAVHEQLLGDTSKQHSYLLTELLERLAFHDKGFTYSLWTDDEGMFIGLAWMTPHMRANAELFGSYISFDSCMRELTELNWPYMAITTRNEFNGIAVLIEAIIIEESEQAYAWLSDTLFNMCPERRSTDYLCVSGDGFFTWDMFQRMGFTNSNFIMDNWHLRESVRKYFSRHKLPPSAYSDFECMLYAKCESDLETSYASLLSSVPGHKHDVIDYIGDLYEKRGHYAQYIISTFVGSRFFRGSNASEQNHSSMLSYVQSSLTKRSKYCAHEFIKELLLRQGKLIDHLNEKLAKAHLQRELLMNGTPLISILAEAIQHLNMPSYHLFVKEVNLSNNLTVEVEHVDTCNAYMVRDKNGLCTEKFIATERCNCIYRRSLLLMCRHEVAAYKTFNSFFFDLSHLFRNEATFSYHKGAWKNQTNSYVGDVKPSGFRDMEGIELSQDEDDDNDDIPFYNNHDGLAATQDNDDIPFYNNHDGVAATQEPAETLDISTSLSQGTKKATEYQQMSGTCTNFLKHFSKQPPAVKSALQGIFLQMTKQMLDGKNAESFAVKTMEIYGYLSGVKSIMKLPPVVKTRDTFVAAPSSGKINRMKSIGEIANVKSKSKRSCRFCKENGHVINNCPKRESLGTVMTYADSLNYIMNKCPYRYLGGKEEVITHLPEGCYYFQILGVVCSENNSSISRRNSSSFEIKNIFLYVSFLDQSANVISTALVAADAVNSKMMNSPKREIFVHVTDCKGMKWHIR